MRVIARVRKTEKSASSPRLSHSRFNMKFVCLGESRSPFRSWRLPGCSLIHPLLSSRLRNGLEN